MPETWSKNDNIHKSEAKKSVGDMKIGKYRVAAHIIFKNIISEIWFNASLKS